MAADPLSRAFAALADPTRRDIVARLTDGDATVGDLAAPYTVSLQAVSKHLKVLEDAGLVSRGRDAQRRPVHLEAQVLVLDGRSELVEDLHVRGANEQPILAVRDARQVPRFDDPSARVGALERGELRLEGGALSEEDGSHGSYG